ncbi:NAD(P)-dependent oxidoreductase [Saccharomonospora piscinae]|nr:NAD(P)H-binding protein [Saccharomonospora piscinae]
MSKYSLIEEAFMDITIFGATGGTGRHLVEQAVEHDHTVTAVVRDPARMPLSHRNLTVLTADVADPAALRPAIAGRDAVLSALAASSKRGDIAATAVRAILRARDSVRRFVVVSAAPVGPVPAGESLLGRALLTPVVRAVFRDVYADLAAMESHVRDSDTDWTIMRPPRLLDTPLTGNYRRALGQGVPGGHSVSRADLAHAMLASLDDPATVRQVVGIAS